MRDDIDIRAIRKTLELSQAALAAELGVDQSTVSSWETNQLPKSTLVRDALKRRLEVLQLAKKLNQERAA